MLRRFRLLPASLAFAAWTCLGLAGAHAQNPFATVARVNESAVTAFEVVQRVRLQQLLRTPGASRELALEDLIDERLQLQAATEAGIVPTEDDVLFGLEDFAARANLTAEELFIVVADIGIDPETLRDFIRVQIAWGEVVRERFTARARPSEAEIDRALALGSNPSGTRVLLSEVLLPVSRETVAVSEERAAAIAGITSFENFEAAARRFSVAPSRADGGRLDWQPLSALPPSLGPLFLTLQPGDVTPPTLTPEGIVLYQLRALEDRQPGLLDAAEIDFARLRFAPGTDLQAEAARIRAEADTCNDLYALYRGLAPEQLVRETAARSAIGGGIGTSLDRLDPGELTIVPPQGAGDGGSILMLCARTAIREEELTRADIERQLFLRRLESFGDSYLAQLRADAFIETPG